jgi:hypothetical protein
MAQSGKGRIELFEDFAGNEHPIALTTAYGNFGQFRVVGDGVAETDSGIVLQESDGLSGVGRLTVTDEDKHACGIATALMFDVGLMGTIVAECRVRFADLDTKDFFFGLSDVNADDISLEDDVLSGATTTITLTASDLCGFYLCSELTDDEDWHMVYNGGTTTGQTTSTSIDADDDAVAGEFQILRLEVAPNGTARWYIDGELLQTQTGAVSTSVDMGVICVVGNKANTSTTEDADVDYVLVRANRDWTA